MIGTSLVGQWLGGHAFTPGGPGSIPGQETKIPHATQQGQKKKNPVIITMATDTNGMSFVSQTKCWREAV